jgi:hypothetical protein
MLKLPGLPAATSQEFSTDLTDLTDRAFPAVIPGLVPGTYAHLRTTEFMDGPPGGP